MIISGQQHEYTTRVYITLYFDLGNTCFARMRHRSKGILEQHRRLFKSADFKTKVFSGKRHRVVGVFILNQLIRYVMLS